MVALCDPRVAAREMAEQWGVPTVYSALDDLLADEGIDAVEILTPTHLHHAHVLAALAAGKHVSVQKPIANTVDEGREMAAAAERLGLTLRVSECYAHYPPLERARSLIAEGAIGPHQRPHPHRGGPDRFGLPGRAVGRGLRVAAQPPESGGHLFDDMVHKYAMALWLVEPDIVSVQAVVRRRDLFFEPCNVFFEYEDPSLLGSMEVSYAPQMWLRSQYYGADEFFEVQGDEGFLWVTRCTGEMLDLAPVMVYRGTQGDPTMVGYDGIDADWGAGFTRSSAHFVDALLDGTTPDMTAADAVKVLQLCFAVYEAGNTGSRSIPGR